MKIIKATPEKGRRHYRFHFDYVLIRLLALLLTHQF